jgi:hypothetical protein
LARGRRPARRRYSAGWAAPMHEASENA